MITATGVVLVAVVLRELFHTLFHPSGQGRVSRIAFAGLWRVTRRLGRRGVPGRLAGPLGMVVVIATWELGVVLGGALVYWPHLPDSFSYAEGLEPAERVNFLDALYLSLVTTATLGYGDIVPTVGWLRLVTPLQAIIGFALLTGAVSWIMQIYPALNRRRTLSVRLAALQRADAEEPAGVDDSAMPAVLLEELSGQVAQARVDLTQNAETYYFRDEGSAALPATLPYAAQLAESGRTSPRRDVRTAAAALNSSLEDLGQVLSEQFVSAEGRLDDILDAYAADHGHRQTTS
ncbi:potassium channel family protein [Blastococcus sp. HT6-30]|uniref:potassium channel family protein n=1 Tax=Blastococcus sp. HT6-30 TaxID=3144843 RepID=UPI00321A9B22